MIHLFNRTELLLTPDLQELNRIRDILASNQIEYRVKANTTLGSSAARDGRPGNTLGANSHSATMYTIYVRRDDLEYAAHLII